MKKRNNVVTWILSLGLMSLSLAPLEVVGAKLSESDLAKKKQAHSLLAFHSSTTQATRASVMGSALTGMTMARVRMHFDETPYFVQSYAQFFQTTKGQSVHEVAADMPYLKAITAYRRSSPLITRFSMPIITE